MLSGIIVAAIAVAVFAFVVATLAGLFKGKNSFPLALVAHIPGLCSQLYRQRVYPHAPARRPYGVGVWDLWPGAVMENPT